ncbi:hypothetical protein EJ08DRAFT_718645 [Tothia fuscella]|uniref:Uncharacterized protein n=1 Tax=Tothia fuscella TaxID=1048955 RepID=A0A9P4TXQ0_9PEZI|nr:hypothetical protein EJ08DRAFT_718645 [Tothia fuscella]
MASSTSSGMLSWKPSYIEINQGMVIFLVSENEEPYHFSEALLRAVSRPLGSMFEGETYREGFSKQTKMEEDDLLTLMCFADRYGISFLTREIMITWQQLDEQFKTVASYETALNAYGLLPQGHVLHHYLVEQYRVYKGASWNEGQCTCGFEPTDEFEDPPSAGAFPAQFKGKIWSANENVPEGQTLDWCDFHHHTGDEQLACEEKRYHEGRCGAREQFVLELERKAMHDEHAEAYGRNAQGSYYSID